MGKRAIEKEKRSGINIMKIGIVLVAILILVIGSGVLWYKISISPVNRNDDKEIEVFIDSGTGANDIAKILKENGLIKNEIAFKIYIKLGNISGLQAGTYYLKPSMDLKEIIEMLKTGKIQDPNQMSITYIEGKNINWLANLIAENTNNTKEEVYALLKDEQYIDSLIEKYWFLDEEIKNKDIYYPLEGYLFPDTYIIASKDVKVEEIFKIMLDRTGEILSKYKDEINKSNYSVHEILTIAAIIEVEGMDTGGRKGVSAVIYNRLDSGMPLQMCTTTYYAIQVDMWTRDLSQREINTYNPYNTRGPNMEGKLPVGPISSVSKTSIEAAIYPIDTDYLFFVSDEAGKLYFTKTNSEHERKIQELKDKGIWHEFDE